MGKSDRNMPKIGPKFFFYPKFKVRNSGQNIFVIKVLDITHLNQLDSLRSNREHKQIVHFPTSGHNRLDIHDTHQIEGLPFFGLLVKN